ncbi:MAG: FAD-dependent oxidoreductase [Oligoflexales bacterium]
MSTARSAQTKSFLVYGNGRSYGDTCLNDDNFLIDLKAQNNLIGFNATNGVIRCQAGMRFDQLLPHIVPQGWFLPVTPGTKFVTVGGAIANDVHGKNHHRDGSFGHHVISLKLLRSDGQELVCSRNSNEDLFRATIGGLGLTGAILEAEFHLIPITSPYMDAQVIRFESIEDFLQLSNESDAQFRYTVAWLDLVSSSRAIKGVFFRGNHSKQTVQSTKESVAKIMRPKITVPFDFPSITLNPISMLLFNNAYWRLHRKFAEEKTHFNAFFYPLDKVLGWNRLYGRNGFLQLQFVLPLSKTEHLKVLLGKIAKSRRGSFLCVAKKFGSQTPPGMLSFPLEGITIAIDFPNNAACRALYKEAERFVVTNNGRLYPAKDAMMSGLSFHSTFDAQSFLPFIDPKFSSTFWRRVSQR